MPIKYKGKDCLDLTEVDLDLAEMNRLIANEEMKPQFSENELDEMEAHLRHIVGQETWGLIQRLLRKVSDLGNSTFTLVEMYGMAVQMSIKDPTEAVAFATMKTIEYLMDGLVDEYLRAKQDYADMSKL